MATANIIFCEQRSEEWREARKGKVTASEIANVLSKPRGEKKSAETTGRMNYRAQIIAEVLTGRPCDDGFISKPMQWGIDNESRARALYELERGFLVDTVGFVEHPRIENFGCSPDGLVSDEGQVQFKCPNTATHIEYLLKGEVPAEYHSQMFAEMSCTGKAWCDFVSFDPRLPQDLQLFVKRLHRDDAEIQKIELAVENFLAEVRDYLVRLASLKDDGLEMMLHKSVALVNARRGPQPVVRIMDAEREEIAGV